MRHVIIDRPRRGGDGGKSILPKGSKKQLQKTPWEDQVKFESSAPGRLYGWECKELNEHLSPLIRWLNSKIGTDWDEVWSEICDGLSVRNATTAHVRDHADRYVEKNCMVKDGKILNSRGIPLNGEWRFLEFYVDPCNNTLQRSMDKFRKHRSKAKIWVDGKDDNHRYYLLKGIWYEVKFKPFPKDVGYRVWDMVISVLWENGQYVGSNKYSCDSFYKKSIYAAYKRQLGKKEIRKLKLRDKI